MEQPFLLYHATVGPLILNVPTDLTANCFSREKWYPQIEIFTSTKQQIEILRDGSIRYFILSFFAVLGETRLEPRTLYSSLKLMTI